MKFTPKTEDELAAAGLFPKGEYDFEVVDASEFVSKAGNEMIALKLNVVDQFDDKTTVFDYLVSTEKALFKIHQFAGATGLMEQYKNGGLTAHDCIGKTGRCKIVITKSEGYADKNSVAEYVKATAASAPPAKRQPAMAGAGDIDDEIPF